MSTVHYLDAFDFVEVADPMAEKIHELNKINEEMSLLAETKEKLVKYIVKKLGLATYDPFNKDIVAVAHDGSQTQEIGRYKVTFKTLSRQVLDKKAYEAIKDDLAPSVNPVREKVEYSVSATQYKQILESGNANSIALVDSFITTKYSPASITILPRG